MQKKAFSVSPPVLMPWIPPDVHKRSLVMLNLEPDFLEENTTKLNLDLAFRGVSIVTRNTVRCVLGCESAVVTVSSRSGRFIDNTGESLITVKNRTKNSEARKSTVTLKPGVSVKGPGDIEASVELGDVTFERGRGVDVESEFESAERVLSPVNSVRVVEWRFDLPKTHRVTRDYIHGNLRLYATCLWEAGPKHCRVEVQPSQWLIYGDDKRPIEGARNLLLRFLLRDYIDKVQALDGIAVTFQEVPA